MKRIPLITSITASPFRVSCAYCRHARADQQDRWYIHGTVAVYKSLATAPFATKPFESARIGRRNTRLSGRCRRGKARLAIVVRTWYPLLIGDRTSTMNAQQPRRSGLVQAQSHAGDSDRPVGSRCASESTRPVEALCEIQQTTAFPHIVSRDWLEGRSSVAC